MGKRGASSIEYMFMVGIALSALVIIITISMNMGNDGIRAAQAKDTVESLAKSADYVYSLGPCSQQTVDVYLPQGISNLTISNNTLRMKVSLSSGDTYVYANTKSNLNGTMRNVSGAQQVTITSTWNETWSGITFGSGGSECNVSASIAPHYCEGSILFLTVGNAPSAYEQPWIDWLSNNYSSDMEFDGTMDIVPFDTARTGGVNVNNYRIVVFADYDGGATNFTFLDSYKSTNHIVLFAKGIYNIDSSHLKLVDTGATSCTTQADDSTSTFKIQNANSSYITSIFSNGPLTITNLDHDIQRKHPSCHPINVTNLAKLKNQDEMSPLFISLQPANKIIAYGESSPNHMNANGILISTRIIDDAIKNGGSCGG